MSRVTLDARIDYGSVASCAEYTKLRSDAPASADKGEGRFQNGSGRKCWGKILQKSGYILTLKRPWMMTMH